MTIAFEPYREVLAVKNLVCEALSLGARFRLSGAAVVIDRLDELPAPLRAELRAYARDGLLRVYLGAEELDEPALDLADQLGVEPVLVDSRADARAAVRRLTLDLRHHGGVVGIDIETAPAPGQSERPWLNLTADGTLSASQPRSKDRTGLDPHRANICTTQLYAGGERCFVFRAAALRLLLGSHWLRRQHLVAHNAGFETRFLQYHCQSYRPPPQRRQRGHLDCTMQATGLLTGVGFGGAGRSLAAAAKSFFGLDVPKELQTSDWAAAELSPGQLAYAASDAVLAWQLWPVLRDRLQQKGRWAAYELQRRAIPAVADMELRGIVLDGAEHHRQTDLWARELATARREYHELTGEPPPSKPAEVRAWLAAALDPQAGAAWPRTPTGELSIASIHLKRLAGIASARPVLALLAKEKLLSTFGPTLAQCVNPVTGRIHCDYNIASTKAGRFSASHPNLQQLPNAAAPEFKKCIVAAPGNLLVGCDWSQIEMRAAAWISGDRNLTRVYAEGRDLHVETAARIAGVPVAAVTKEQRQAAKPVNFGALYGIGPAALAANAYADYAVDMSAREAQRALDRFWSAYPQLADWRQRNADICQRRGYVTIGAGRVVEARWEPGGRLSFPQCCNLPVQGICSDALLRAIALAYRRLRRGAIRGGIVACIHDELLLEVHRDDAAEGAEVLETAMRDAFSETFPGAPTRGVAQAAIGHNWAEARA